MRAPPTWLLALFMLPLSGCAGTPSHATQAGGQDAPLAPEEPETGTLEGIVADAEAQPVAGVEVSLVETLATQTTNANGTFRFTGLQPGAYTLVATRLGYEQAARQADVAAGQTTRLDVTLAALRVTQDPYHFTVNHVAHIVAGNALATTIWYQGVNESAYNSLACSPCRFGIYIDRGPADVLTEPVWERAVSAPYVNEMIFINFLKNGTDEDTANHAYYDDFTNRQSVHWPESGLDELKDQDWIRMWVRPSLLAVSVDHRVSIWNTFAYEEPLSESFTALPPA